MKDFFNNKLAATVCSIGIIIILILSIFLIVNVWKSKIDTALGKDNQEDVSQDIINDSTVGVYENVDYSLQMQLKKYMNNLSNKLRYEDINGLYSLLDVGYISYSGMDKTSFNDMLSERGLFGRKFELVSYKQSTYNNKNIFVLEYKSTDNVKNGTINLIETSPNDFKIAFDDFVSYTTVPFQTNQDGLRISLYDQIWFNSKFYVKVSIKNLNDYDYIINPSGLYENNYLKFIDGSEKRTLSTTISGETITLEKNKEISYSLEFDIPELGFGSVDSLIIKDITASSSGIKKDYQISIN